MSDSYVPSTTQRELKRSEARNMSIDHTHWFPSVITNARPDSWPSGFYATYVEGMTASGGISTYANYKYANGNQTVRLYGTAATQAIVAGNIMGNIYYWNEFTGIGLKGDAFAFNASIAMMEIDVKGRMWLPVVATVTNPSYAPVFLTYQYA
jgi:hypothetical protein